MICSFLSENPKFVETDLCCKIIEFRNLQKFTTITRTQLAKTKSNKQHQRLHVLSNRISTNQLGQNDSHRPTDNKLFSEIEKSNKHHDGMMVTNKQMFIRKTDKNFNNLYERRIKISTI